MYDRAITARALEIANSVIADGCRAAGKPVWELERHTSVQIDYARSSLADLYDPEQQRLRRALRPDEAQFIENERIMCALDFRDHWLPNYARIIDWQKRPSTFTPNVAQAIILDLWAESEAAGEAIWMQQLKARRLGVSTLSELNVCHRFQFQAYANCVVASADPTKTVEMAAMIKYCLDEQPWWLLPEVTKVSRGIPVEFGKQHATLAIQAGNQFTGVARGSSPNIIHLSELCEWRDAESLIDGALLPAILDTPDVFGILESTGKGPGWWKIKWEQTKRDWERSRARLRPVFLPWYVGTDIYPTPADLRKRPIPPNWIPSERTVAHAERARQYVTSNPLLLEHLAHGDRNWKMPRQQMWWREIGYDTAREEKKLNIFLAEYCSDDIDAFQSNEVPVIDTEVLLAYQDRTRVPLGAYTIIGPDIPPQMVAPLRRHDQSREPITIRTRDLLPRFDATYQLVPLKFEGYPTFDEALVLLVWEWPHDGQLYGIGVDTSEGLGHDNAVMQVLREATPMREPGQVAEWASNTVTAFQLWPLVMAVGTWYSTVHPTAGIRRQCRLAIEAFSNGASTQNELQKRGWTNFHPWKYNDTKRPKPDAQVSRVGIYTNVWFRATMFDMLLTCLGEEAIDLPSPYLVGELSSLVNNQGKVEAGEGAYDDRVMGIGFPLYSLHMNKPPLKQFTRRRVAYQPGLSPEPRTPHPIWTPGDQASSVAFGGKVAHQPADRYSRAGGLRGLVDLLRPIGRR